MKKIYSLALMLVAGLFALSSCSEDRDSNPTIQTPTQFVLNTPALAEQYIQLSADNSVNLTWSQPNYGYNAFATYMVQVGITENGQTRWNEDVLTREYTVCNANVNGQEIAEAICALDGVTGQDDYVDKGFREIAFRVISVIKTAAGEEVPGTRIVSNPVAYKHIASYCAVKSAAYIYIIGSCNGWTEPAANKAEELADWRIYETEIGSNVFKGSVEMPAGDLTFRFYTELTGWDGGASIGLISDDVSTPVSFENNVYSSELVSPGKGSWQFNGFAGGFITITVDMNQKLVKFEYTGGEQQEMPNGYIYLVGAPEGWTGPTEDNAAHYDDWKLYSYPSTGEGIYTGEFDIAEGKFMFRFYTALTGWDADSYGSQEADSPIDIALIDGMYEGDATKGKGSWNIPDWNGGKVKIVVDTKNNKVSFTKL